ncbi:MAG: hypothetical protein C3F06_08740 [Candidatus Methanoperedenaceae archaeon]|nr:MAG: hypothetical protein C3F06_08740 [Candidatus Methanoperedenaceae archaeon]
MGEEVLSEIDKVTKSIENTKIRPNDDIFVICYDAIEEVLDDLKEQVRKEVESADFDIENFKKEIPALVLSIEHFITPNEIIDIYERTNKPANLISILNAGWIFYLTRKEKLFENLKDNTLEGKLTIISKLNDMILKAIELSQAHEMWLQYIDFGDENSD